MISTSWRRASSGEHRGLADRAGTLEHDHGRLGHPVGDDRQDPAVDQGVDIRPAKADSCLD